MTDKTNKTEMGMNRNAFYEYKKDKILEMVRQGAGVSEMANALGMGDKDMYAFLSRNFGGIRRLKEMANSTKGFGSLQMASMEIEKDEPKSSKKTNNSGKKQQKKNGNKITSKSSNKKGNRSGNALSDLSAVLQTEKDKLISEFKRSIETESQAVLAEAQKNLVKARDELINGFKQEIVTGLSVSFKK